LNFTALQITNFAGGITDNVIGRSPSMYKTARNFLITVYGKLKRRPGSTVDGANDTQGKIADGVEHLMPGVITSDKPFKLTTASNEGRLYYYDGSTHSELTGPTGNSLFTTSHGAASDHRFVVTSWNKHGYITSTSLTEKVHKVYRDSGGTLRLRTAGLPIPSGTAPTFNAPGTAGTYLTAFVWKYTYTVGARTFIDRGPVYYSTTLAAIPGTVTIAANMAIANSTTLNYDTASANLVLEYYRTISNGTVYYLVDGSGGTYNSGFIENANINGANTIGDGVADANLVTSTRLYTTGGVLDNTNPPVCKYMHISERGIAYYGHVIDGSDTISNRVVQSKIGDPDSVPPSFFDDLDDDVTAISSHRGLPIFFSPNNVYRGDGVYDSFGGGGLVSKKIANFAGSVSHNGIVQTPFGVIFPGINGFYWTDGYTVTKISDEINAQYTTAYPTTSALQSVVGTYDELNQRVYFTYVESASLDACFVLDLRYGIKPNSVFTTIGGAPETSVSGILTYPSTVPTTISANFKAKSILFYNSTLYRADNRGYVMYFDSTKTSDPRVVTADNISAWGTSYIKYDYESVALDFGTRFARKWSAAITPTFKNVGDLSAQIKVDRNLEGTYRNLREFRARSDYSWGDSGILWGDEIIYASQNALYEERRLFPAGGLRCSYRSVRIVNAFTVIQKSDNAGPAVIDATAKTATLSSPWEWPTDILDYYITFSNDSYVKHFLITARNSSTVLTFSDATNLCPSTGSSVSWMIYGFAKEDNIQIESLVLPHALLTDSQTAFTPASEGQND
jgi:hypothetical protein